MANREKKEIYPTLKCEVKSGDDTGIVFTEEHEKNVYEIVAINDVDTRYDKKNEQSCVIVLQNGDERVCTFLNGTSQNNLIDAFGNDDEKWKKKSVRLKKEFNKKFKKDMIVIYPNK